MSRSFMLLPLLSLALSAQGVKPATKPAAKAAAKPGAQTKAKSAKSDDSPVLARIGGSVLTQADVDAFLENLPPQQRMQLQYTPGGMGRMVQELAELKLVAEMARRDGLEDTPTYQRRLQSVKTQLLTRAYLEQKDTELRAKGEVNDEEVKAYFEGHKEKFETPATYDARHILIGKRPQGAEKDRTEEEMQARVKEVMSAVAAGKPFEDLVESFTDDGGSKNTKGLYQAVRKGQFVPEFEKAALSQEIGKVGEPVKTQYGLHIIRVEKRSEAEMPAFDAVKDNAKQQAQQEKSLKVWNDLIASLKKVIPFEMVPPPAAKPAPVMIPAPAAKPAPAKAEGDKQ